MNPILKDIRCQLVARVSDNKVVAYIAGDEYRGAENNYNPIRHTIAMDLEGLFRLQREIAEQIEKLAMDVPLTVEV